MKIRRAFLVGVLVSSVGLSCAGNTEGDGRDAEIGRIEQALTGLPFSLSYDSEYQRLVIDLRLLGADGAPVRTRMYHKFGPNKGWVVFANGRSEFVEKYDALFTALHEYPAGDVPAAQTLADLPLSVATLDHEGQGESIEGRTRGHIDDYDLFVSDLKALIRLARLIGGRHAPIYLVSHSMGGLIATRFVQENPGLVSKLVLGSPLFKMRAVPGLPEEGLRFVATFYTQLTGMPKLCTAPAGLDQPTVIGVALCAGGLLEGTMPGCQACFNAPDGCGVPAVQGLKAAFAYLQTIKDQGCPPSTFQCPAPWLTTDDAYCQWSQTHPLAGPEPTFGWLSATFAAIDEVAAAPRVATPTLLLSNPFDVVVDPAGHTCDKFSSCQIVTYPGYGHELFTAAQRAEPIAAVRAFLGY